MRTRYWTEIQAAAKKHGLDPILVEAIVVQESAGNADAFRFEPNFWNRYLKPLKMYLGANPRRVSSSYGLMQVMYRVAVERGFPDNLHPELLFVPETALDYGCRQLKHQILDAEAYAMKHGIASDPAQRLLAAIASYNGGSGGNRPGGPLRNLSYVKSVMANYDALRNEHSA